MCVAWKCEMGDRKEDQRCEDRVRYVPESYYYDLLLLPRYVSKKEGTSKGGRVQSGSAAT
jgi:hypothetical protein